MGARLLVQGVSGLSYYRTGYGVGGGGGGGMALSVVAALLPISVLGTPLPTTTPSTNKLMHKYRRSSPTDCKAASRLCIELRLSLYQSEKK